MTEVGENGVGDAGDINIQANALIIENGADIAAQTEGQGDAGDITITTNESISLSNDAEIRSLVEFNATGNGGNILLTTGELNLADSSRIIADTTGTSSNEGEISTAGNIDINVSGDINLENSSQIQSQTRNGAVGNAGNITINADGSLFSRGGNLILADSQATGNGGNIKIDVGGQVLLEGLSQGGFPSQIAAGLSRENAEGTGGSIEIKASELILEDLAFISSNTVSNSFGSAGSIAINVDDLTLANNSFIDVLTGNNFDGGSISVNTQNLNLESGGKILAATDGGGNAGNIQLNVNDRTNINNGVGSSADFVDFGTGSQLLNDLQSQSSGIYADASESATGNGGNIFLSSQILELDNNGTISAATGFGQGGAINLNIADTLILKNNSSISARAFNGADGGNLNIDSQFIVAFPSSGDGNDIIANAEQGIGGNIKINSTLLGIEEGSATENNNSNDIDASSEFSLDGNITINTPDNSLIQGAIELPKNVVEPKETIAQACQADRKIADANSFVIRGKGGIPAAPDLPLDSNNITINGKTSSTSTIPEAVETSQGKIQPARGVEITESGEVILTAYRTNNQGERISQDKRNCGV